MYNSNNLLDQVANSQQGSYRGPQRRVSLIMSVGKPHTYPSPQQEVVIGCEFINNFVIITIIRRRHIGVFLDMSMSQAWDKVENEYTLVILLQMIVSKK